MTRVLITDGEQRASLALVRSLGRAGHEVIVCASRRRTLAGISRHAREEILTPDPLDAPGEFDAAVRNLCAARRIHVLLPVTDAAMSAIDHHRARAAGIRIPFPSSEVHGRISDKALLVEQASGLGIAVPAQIALSCAEERHTLDLSALPYPVVVKPARSIAATDGGRAKFGVRHAATPNDLARVLDQFPPQAYPLLLQQRIAGPGIGVFLLVWDGELSAVFSHRRLREKPPSGGVSVYRESIAADPALVEASRALLARFGWYGVAMVEYKVDDATGTPRLMEVNARFWGSLQLAIDSGVDFPNLLVSAALGGRCTPVRAYRVGVRSRWWWGDVDHLLTTLRRSRKTLGLAPGAPGRVRTLLAFLILWRPGDRNEVLRLDDPLPFVVETLDWLRGR
ncbi:MAG: ATP-grasp domain-containing protein [Gemmatimonadaceae bacterium]